MVLLQLGAFKKGENGNWEANSSLCYSYNLIKGSRTQRNMSVNAQNIFEKNTQEMIIQFASREGNWVAGDRDEGRALAATLLRGV